MSIQLFNDDSQFVDFSMKSPEKLFIFCVVCGKVSISHQQKIKHRTKWRWQAENLSELQLERFFFGADVYENGN
jgi:hypothetical protein